MNKNAELELVDFCWRQSMFNRRRQTGFCGFWSASLISYKKQRLMSASSSWSRQFLPCPLCLFLQLAILGSRSDLMNVKVSSILGCLPVLQEWVPLQGHNQEQLEFNSKTGTPGLKAKLIQKWEWLQKQVKFWRKHQQQEQACVSSEL